jgi:hypothetical protein
MKKTTIIGILVVSICGYSGYTIGKDHNRPRVKTSRYVIHQLLKQPQPDDYGSFKLGDDNSEVIMKRYEEVEKGEFFREEKWDSWTSNTEVRVIYDTDDNEIRIVCDKLACAKP